MMREWDELIARQVAAAGVRTTWGEHVALPGGEVTMTDDRIILSAEGWYAALDSIDMSARGIGDGSHPLEVHDAALRARLTAAEAERDQAIRTREEVAQAWARRRDQAERHAAQVVALTEALRAVEGVCDDFGDGVSPECSSMADRILVLIDAALCGRSLDAALAAADQTDEGDK